jgi:hypothetical protein
MRTGILLLAILFALPAQAAQRQHTIVVGNNASIDPGVAPLRFADDDAARYAEFFGPLSASLELLSVLDPETQALYPELARRTEPPTVRALEAALVRVRTALEADRARGDQTTVLFVFVGHGNVGANREGYVSLIDGRFTRGDLYEKVLAGLPADFTHVVIDACNAYLMVNRRGGEELGPAFGDLVRGYLEEQELTRYPHVGVVLSTSGERESHEWAGFRAGIFTHELLSGLSGAADVNGDARIEYGELRAFVASANLKVEDPRARPEIWARPPARDRSRPLADLRAQGFERFLLFPSSMAGRFYVEDPRGVRLADFNKAPDRSLALALPARPYYFLRTETTEVRIEPRRGLIDVGALTWSPLALASRGSLDQTFRRSLFEVPFGIDFYRGFAATSGDQPVGDPQRRPAP